MLRAWIAGNLRRRPGLVLLFVLEVALGTLVVFMSLSFAQAMTRWNAVIDRGDPELRGIEVWSHGGGAADEATARRREADDLAALRAVAGLVAVAPVERMPQERFRSPRRAIARGAPDAPRPLIWPLAGGLELPATLDARFTAGRAFAAEDQTAGRPVAAIVARPLADLMFPEGAVGRRFELHPGAELCEIVGVVETVPTGRSGMPGAALGVLLLTRRPDRDGHVIYAVRSSPEAAARGATALASLEPDRSISVIGAWRDLQSNIETNKRSGWWSIGAAVTIILLCLAGAATMGALLVAERTREIGILRALGATRRDVIWLFVVHHLAMTTVALLLGSVASLALQRALVKQNVLLVFDPGILALTWALLLVASGTAAVLSSRRAASIPPHTATRTV